MSKNYEIEIKYLLQDFNMKDLTTKFFKKNFKNLEEITNLIKLNGDDYTQYYLDSLLAKKEAEIRKIENPNEFKTIRIRKIKFKSKIKNEKYILTLKSKPKEFKRREYEFNINKKEFNYYLRLSKFGLSKKRLIISHPENNYLNIEFDLFNKNKSQFLNNLILAEVEVNSQSQLLNLTNLGKNVSNNYKYSNSNLAKLNEK